jgi:hypothetical protein
MAPPSKDEEPKFRFRVNIMPPRRPANSLLKRLHKSEPELPLHIIAVPARASETFADVWKHIKERYERNYTAEEVANGWFHKLQDRYGADIDSHDGVGELGYTVNSPKEDLVLIMLQNGIDRDGSVPETSGLRPPGFTRPELSAEQEQELERRKAQEERYGVALEDVDEDTPIESRERSLGPGSPELGAPVVVDDSHKIDADGFTVPLLPGSVNRKRKRPRTIRGDVIPSSMEGENEEDILVQDSQTASNGVNNGVKGSSKALPNDDSMSRTRTMHSMPADASAGAPTSSARAKRARTTAPIANADHGPLHLQRLAALQATSSKHTTNAESGRPQQQPRSPPTPVSATSQPFTQQPPESAQRPKSTPPVVVAPVVPKGQRQLVTEREAPEDGLDFDPIEDDDLLQGIAGTADDDRDDMELGSGLPLQPPPSTAPVSTKSKPGKLAKPNKSLSLTPKASTSVFKKPTSTPANNALERLSGTQGSTGKNPRSQPGFTGFWTPELDNLILQGIREGLGPAETTKKFNFEGRTQSAVRGRRVLLIKKNPGIEKATQETIDDGERSVPSATKRRAWSIEEKQIMTRKIKAGFDALEIHAECFPGRSEDSVNRAVLSLQDQAWKAASMDQYFPRNGAKLPGWTLKDSCKLKRTFGGMSAGVAKKTYFGRWTEKEVQKQMDDYRAQIKAIEARSNRASQAGSALKKAVFGSSQLPADSSQLPVNSSPVERSMQARAARRPSVDAQHRISGIEVPSSPPQAAATQPSYVQAQTAHKSPNQVQRSSSPAVEIPVTEQETAREKVAVADPDASREAVPRPSSGSGRQSTLNFLRDKGKERAGDPRPTPEELDAQFGRRFTSARINRPAAQPQQITFPTVSPQQSRLQNDEDDVYDDHTPAEDLEMLAAGLEQGESSIHKSTGLENGLVPEVQPKVSTKADQDDTTIGQTADQAHVLSDDRRPSTSTAMTMQSPMTTSSTSSGRRRRSRVESGVDTRVAAQLSQELNRSISREEREEAAHEDQVFSTPDPKINRYHRPNRPSTVTFSEDAVMQDKDDATMETQTFRTQDPTTTRSQRASRRVSFQTEQSPRSTGPGPDLTPKVPDLQPSPQIGTSESGDTRAITPATTPAKPGKLPNRGQSYASRIKDIHRPAQSVTNAAARVQIESPRKGLVNDSIKSVRDDRSPSPIDAPPTDAEPTDAEIWEKAAIAESLGRDRQEYFEDLKISTFSIRAMGRGDWDEVKRLKAEERRLRRERKIARGVYVPSTRDTQHPNGPAEGGDAEQADEDVIRADDVSDASSEIEDDGDEKIWSEADFEQPPDIDHDRHFSEVEDNEVLDQSNGQADKAIAVPEEVDRSRHVSEVIVDEEMIESVDKVQEIPQANGVNITDVHEEHADELDLPTVHTLNEPHGEAQHALTDDNLQELNNSGAEGSPTRKPGRKRKLDQDTVSPKSRRSTQKSDDRAAMPPPVSTGAKDSKRNRRRKRLSGQRPSKSGSERSSSFSHPHPSSDAAQQHAPSTPVQSEPAAHRSKRARVSETTPSEQSPKAPRTQMQQSTGGNQNAPSSSTRGSQRTTGGGLSGLVRKAHIPTPPKVKRTPQKDTKAKKLDIRASDDESDESSDSD